MSEYTDSKKNFQKLLQSITKYNNYDVFRDFVFLCSYSLQQAVDFSEEIENKWKEIENRYSTDELDKLANMFAEVGRGLTYQYGDFLGECFMELGLNSTERGQIFTPYHLCLAIAELCCDKEKLNKMIQEKGFVSVYDPACGGGALPISYCEICLRNDINYQNKVLFICQDLDERCARMCHIQLSILGASAVIRIGDTLKNEVHQELYTIMYGVNYKKFKPVKETLEKQIAETQEPVQLQLF